MSVSVLRTVLVVAVVQLLIGGGQLSAKGLTGKAVISASLTTRDAVFTACQDMIMDAQYTIESIDASSGFISATSTSRPLGSKKSYTYTWSISVRSNPQSGATEVRMSRGTQQTFAPKDVDKLFVYLFETMGLDLSMIPVTIDGEVRPANEWKKKKRKWRRKKNG